jgi:hypothetical protein
MIATGNRGAAFEPASVRRLVSDGMAASVWQLQLSAGSEQHAPVVAFGVGSPQHGDALLSEPIFVPDAALFPRVVRVAAVVLQQLLVEVAAGCRPEVELICPPEKRQRRAGPPEMVNEQSRKVDTYAKKNPC